MTTVERESLSHASEFDEADPERCHVVRGADSQSLCGIADAWGVSVSWAAKAHRDGFCQDCRMASCVTCDLLASTWALPVRTRTR